MIKNAKDISNPDCRKNAKTKIITKIFSNVNARGTWVYVVLYATIR